MCCPYLFLSLCVQSPSRLKVLKCSSGSKVYLTKLAAVLQIKKHSVNIDGFILRLCLSVFFWKRVSRLMYLSDNSSENSTSFSKDFSLVFAHEKLYSRCNTWIRTLRSSLYRTVISILKRQKDRYLSSVLHTNVLTDLYANLSYVEKKLLPAMYIHKLFT